MMPALRHLVYFLVSAWWPMSASGMQPCSESTLVVPPKATTQSDSRPLLVWRHLSGISRYRVQLESRIPNGPVIARIDQVVTGTQFTPAQPLAEDQAVVKVRVSAACDTDTQGTVSELGPAFFIDARKRCPAPEDVRVRVGGVVAMDWRAAPGVRKTEISIFSAADGRLLSKDDSIGAHVELPIPHQASTIALRSRCADSVSETVYRVLSAAAR